MISKGLRVTYLSLILLKLLEGSLKRCFDPLLLEQSLDVLYRTYFYCMNYPCVI